ncbi:hypothetical protein AXF42_Ash018848 [Apostasia shenzhenica]|uniref:DUF8040 domain-containing protein n=1 Tax=Apostasia shenzhenica TaxID=1088818 RepID=A0A2I0B179_9ASPA|nr:hypothetical protein AXF42_Ash018848 [Apostasia shenzhenica]
MYNCSYSGHQYIHDLLEGYPDCAVDNLCMSAHIFLRLRNLLISRGVIENSHNITAAEQLAIFLCVITHSCSLRSIIEFFQHSLETTSRYFNLILDGLFCLEREYLNIPNVEYIGDSSSDAITTSNIFKDAIGAIDGTHISAIISSTMHERFINRKGSMSQNVMMAVGFDSMIHFVVAGWGGSAADSIVLRWALENTDFFVPNGNARMDQDVGRIQSTRLTSTISNTSIGDSVRGEMIRERLADILWQQWNRNNPEQRMD